MENFANRIGARRIFRWFTLVTLGAWGHLVVADEVRLTNSRYVVRVDDAGRISVSQGSGAPVSFTAAFKVLATPDNPALALRPAGIAKVAYNVPSWQTAAPVGAATLKAVRRSTAQEGDGFDDRILKGDTKARTADVFAAATATDARPTGWSRDGDGIRFSYVVDERFALSSTLTVPEGDAEPILAYVFTPKVAAYFSVGFVGAPEWDAVDCDEFWQPFIWQEKRFPTQSYLTPAFECPVPATFVRRGQTTVGVVVDSAEFPFDPLPLLDNSRFGVALRNPGGRAQPMVFAPILGGTGSRREAGEAFAFRLRLYVGSGDATSAFEETSRRLYGFRDYRSNSISSTNATLDAMIDYGMSHFSWFVDEMKGCAYSTDVPGAVKNVSSLNPLNLALVTDNQAIFDQRAYPILEFMVSREKFLFSLDPKQKIQSPSRRMAGPAAPVSELAALYGISHGASPVFRTLADRLLGEKRTLNLDDVSEGNSWQNHLRLYQATGEATYLDRARAGADAYLATRMDTGATDFSDPGLFFWTAFAPKWIDLLELYEATQDQRYLVAARLGARRFAMFTWTSPQIPDADITVNPGGKAPVYWYLQSKGHAPMLAAEEKVPAWRLSEIGLTPESSGTMSGHRAIFMANYAPWMLRVAALTNDGFLHDVARSAVIGRYRNFPGYHINTARTTLYEAADFPLRAHKELSLNSFHYNHIWPHMSLLLDFLVTDAFARSGGAINFPSRFIEGYAYLQNKFYGDRPGRFYGYNDAVLWMPQRLAKPASVEINYIAARGENRLYLAFSNQSRDKVSTQVELDRERLPQAWQGVHRVRVITDGKKDSWVELKDGRFPLEVSPMGLTAVVVEGLAITPRFQDRLLKATAGDAWSRNFIELAYGGARAMVMNFGPETTKAYIYLQADDAVYREVTLDAMIDGQPTTLHDKSYPFEFTIPLGREARSVRFTLTGVGADGQVTTSETAELKR